MNSAGLRELFCEKLTDMHMIILPEQVAAEEINCIKGGR